MDPDEGTAGVHRELATDVLVNILTRLPANTRRLLRLVCRHWRDVVGTRTATNLRSRAKTLVAATGYAYVVEDLCAPAPVTRHRVLWTGAIDTARLYEAMNIVGTCNGLVCLCDNDGAITVANPVTGEALPFPPLPPPAQRRCYSRSWHEGYGFAYLPATRQYKVVHVPCCVNGTVFDTVQVITLGEASWRDVPAGPTARFDNGYGVVSVDGSVYWAASEHAEKVMSFSLDDERVAPITSLPSVLLSNSKGVDGWHLAEVQGRLGIVASHIWSTEVWVMERAPGRGEQLRWIRWYVVQQSTPTRQRCLTWPVFVHGEHVLAWEQGLYGQAGCVLHMHTPIQDAKRAKRGVVDIGDTARCSPVAGYVDMTSYLSYRRTFAYVETKEPLSGYKSTAV